MKVLGIRNSSNGMRFCILKKEDVGGPIEFLNKDKESKINKPQGYEGKDLYIWYQSEIERILDTNEGIEAVAIKQNENNVQSCYSKLKDVMFFDCIASMSAFHRDLKVDTFVYNQLSVSSKTVKDYAEKIVGCKTNKYWDEKIADAIVVASKIIKG